MQNPRNNGFTIIELLIVISITSAMFVVVLTTYVQIQKVLKTQSETAVQGQEAEEFYRTLSQDIQNLVYDSYTTKYFFTIEKSIISGNRIDFMNFITGSIYSNPQVLQSSIRNVTYYGEVNGENGKVTIFRKEDMFADYEEKTLGVPVPVLNRVNDFRVEFSRTGNDWVDEWDLQRMRSMPQFIRITYKFEENNDTGIERKVVLETSPGIMLQ